MKRVNCYCYECDTEFKVSFPGGDTIKFCPICGTELEIDDEAEQEEE